MNLLLSAKVVLPICIYLLIGLLAKKVKWIGDEGVTQTNRLVYKLFFPMLMFVNIYQADLSSTLDWKLLGLMYGCLTVVFLALILLVPASSQAVPVRAASSKAFSGEFDPLRPAHRRGDPRAREPRARLDVRGLRRSLPECPVRGDARIPPRAEGHFPGADEGHTHQSHHHRRAAGSRGETDAPGPSDLLETIVVDMSRMVTRSP